MLIQKSPPLHLTYSMNVHPGESWEEVRAAITTYASSIKQRVAPAQPFGLGLRLSRRACDELQSPEARAALRRLLEEHDLYVFTINGFPYGRFHGRPVGADVYAPDWREPARREYTILLARLLSELLPEGVPGSISTVPGSFRPWIQTPADVKAIVANLTSCAEEIRRLCEECGRNITVALEPEPGCWLETTADTIRFFLEELPDWTRPFLSVCVDTCHFAVQFENPVAALRAVSAAGVRIGKVQLSAAVETRGVAFWDCFRDGIYLHQVRVRRPDGSEAAWLDMSDAQRHIQVHDIVRAHFHVPLYCPGTEGWKSTANELSADFFDEIRSGVTSHLEVETYTFDVLPAAWKIPDVVESLARELEWVRARVVKCAG